MKKIAVLFFCFFIFSICSSFAKKNDKETGVRIAPSASVYQNDSSNVSEEDSASEEVEQNYKNNNEQNDEQEHEYKYQYNFVQKEVEEEDDAVVSKENKKEKRVAKQLKKKGWEPSTSKTLVKRNGRNTEVVQGIAKMQTVSQNGSVAFYVAGLKGTWFPIVETNDFAESTYVSLFVDGVECRFNRSRNTDYYFEVDDDSITVTYRIAMIAELKVTYKFAELKNKGIGYENTSILVSYSLVNIDRMAHTFALKVVYNTILGENFKSHFIMPSNYEVNTETIIIPSAQNKYVVSSDGKRSAKFVIYEAGMTSAKKVVLANKDTIENSSLLTEFRKGRPFNSLLSYNNSSIGLFWEENAFLEQDENIFYRIEFSNYDLKESSFEEEPEPVVVPEPEPEPAIEQPEPVKEVYPFKTERNYLDPSINENYVRKLIDQINTLERSDPDLNREKIQELQNEIDEVLRILRSRR